MERRDCTGEQRHQREVELTCRRESIKQALLWEAGHLHNPVHRRSVAVKLMRPIALARDRQHATIQRRRRSPIQADFCFTHRPAKRARRKVEIVESHRSFQLVCTLSREEDDGAVRVDSFDGRTTMG